MWRIQSVRGSPIEMLARALVIDDNVDVAESLTWLLEGIAHEVRFALSGEAALQLARDFQPDLVLCDIVMPDMDGYETCRRLRQLPGCACAFVVALSGYGSPEDLKRSQEAGFDRHLVKPIDRAGLEELIENMSIDAPASRTGSQAMGPAPEVIDWLLDSDPAIRWQVLRDLVHTPGGVVAAERARVAAEGWGARLLASQGEDGQWAGGACFPAEGWNREEGQPWTSTLPTLQLLYGFGVDPRSERMRRAVARVREGCRWEHAGQPFFSGEVEPCINGRTVALGAYFDEDVSGVVARLLGEQLEDGGWNCEAENGSVRSSFHSTINVLEGLLAHERATGGSAESIAARRRGEEYLLERKLMRRKSTGEPVNAAWLQFSFPVRWHYDVLRGLDYFRSVGDAPDPRLEEAVELLRSKRQPDGAWLLENTHRGKVHFALEESDGRPSRWNTLRALRVLDWYELRGEGGQRGGREFEANASRRPS